MGNTIRLTAGDGHELAAYQADPEGPPKGAIVIIQEIFGVNGHIRSVCDGYAADGYVAIAPALFDRVERGIELGYDEPDMGRGRETRGKLGWDGALADVKAAAEAVKSAGKVAVAGGQSDGFAHGCSLPDRLNVLGLSPEGAGGPRTPPRAGDFRMFRRVMANCPAYPICFD